MSSFHVQFEELRHTVGELRSLAGGLHHITEDPPNLYGHSGSKDVDKAVDSFFSEWTQGMHTTRDNVGKLADALGKALAAYSTAESQCAGGAGGG